MSELVDKAVSVWDWPLRSHFAKTAEQKKSLRATADFGATVGGIVGGAASFALFDSHSAALLLSFSSVLLGFYGGSACWKIHKSNAFTP